LTERLAAFLAGSRWQDVPQPIRQEAKRALLNAAGCLIAGRRDPTVQRIAETLEDPAVVNAAAITAYDYDDTHLRTVIHPSAPGAGALFAMAGEKGMAGVDFLHAFVLGVETACRIGNAVSPGHYAKGWHITGTCGVFGAAAAAGKIFKLNAAEFRNALGIAATQSAGLIEMLPTPSRVLSAGFAARNGIVAARLAAAGLEAAAQPLEGKRGFIAVYGGENNLSEIENRLGDTWELEGLDYKPYPCGVVIHATIDACLQLRGAEALTIRLHPLAIERCDRPEPRDAQEARLSAQHAAAVAVLHGAAGLEQFSAAAVSDPKVVALRRRVKVVMDDKIGKAAAVVSDGRRTVEMPGPRAMSDADLEAKFRALAGAAAETWMQFVYSLESTHKVVIPH
jgi:2-methylcitrate dehydratase PrpD